MENQNESEQVFEKYLDLNGFHGKWTYEPSLPGKTKKPDYLLDLDGESYFLEVKELRKKLNEPTKWPAHIDPYSGVRAKVDEARKKFKQFKECSCSLVVYNVDDKQAKLDPLWVLASMLGNLGLTGSYDPSQGQVLEGSGRSAFLDGGKMLGKKKEQRQNTTISAIVVLEKLLDNRNVQKAMNEQMKRQGRTFTGPEKVELRLKLYQNHSVETVPRVVAVENPFARIPLPEDLFRGPFDERWRWMEEQNGKVKRVFAGDSLRELEALDRDKPWDRLP